MDQPEVDLPAEEEVDQPVAGSSSSSRPKVSKPTMETVGHYPVGSFLVAMYDTSWFLGQVEGCDLDEEKDGYTFVKYMEKKGENKFAFTKSDMMFTLNSDILMSVDHPEPVSNRGFWGLPSETLKKSGEASKGWFIFYLVIRGGLFILFFRLVKIV